MNKKAAIELSTNFLVVIIISIIVLGMGFIFLNNALDSGNVSIEQLDKDIENQIESLLTDGTKPVALPIVEKTIERKKSAQFGIGVYNLDKDATEFSVRVSEAMYLERSTTSGTSFPLANASVMAGFDLANDGGSKKIAYKTNEKFIIPIKVDKAAPAGTYVFNVCVCKGTSCEEPCSSTSPNLYSGQIYKIYVKVP